ncbi:MAG: damage-inducible protein DinB [Calditrichaeota bacterium]|nr:MAG: damage-inducible protein DinB [Calditrichota bacterium]MBL1206489.1 damage-inducible protein DinB [Calditrichota bacterium]NOG46316.1 damage-inducible protein DinB [Calditrichota bacterium]
MKELFREIFEYHFEFNQRMFKEIEKEIKHLPETSFPLFCHILNAHQIWNARILSGDLFGVNQIHEISECSKINLDNYQNTFNILDDVDFGKIIHYQNSRGEKFNNKVSDILFHIANHSTHHRGQIISDFRKSGIQPIVSDYIFYKR